MDFTQYPESYYFHDGPGDTSLARTIKYAADLAEQAQRAQHAGIPFAASVLTAALDDLTAVLDDRSCIPAAPDSRFWPPTPTITAATEPRGGEPRPTQPTQAPVAGNAQRRDDRRAHTAIFGLALTQSIRHLYGRSAGKSGRQLAP
ncbi:hypothetical protein QQM39_02935 [Streptomyces sp. DT2A-34]|uniref:hypothetical protein n=1 Tax=Streptomyces sp. DT2A-34 TaxID=3051182 RepID=UPI00265C5EA9|nr:hypothetical protein [Streptomyces sp. DT2A-34]MDO0909852.1 hypothetical protein [Streptomyces sp. DT2A-34]